MNGVYLLIGTFFIIAVILVTVVLVLLEKHKYNTLRQQVENLDKEKNLIASTPVYSELAKVESIVKNEKMEEKYKNWQKRFDVIKEERINLINDMINELDVNTSVKNYRAKSITNGYIACSATYRKNRNQNFRDGCANTYNSCANNCC